MKWQFKEDHTLGKFYHIFTTPYPHCNLLLLPTFTHINPWDEQGWRNTRKCIEIFLDQRCQESNKIRQKYPDRIPVIVQKVEGSNIEKIDKRKYLVSWLLKIPILHMDPISCPYIKWPYKINKSILYRFQPILPPPNLCGLSEKE